MLRKFFGIFLNRFVIATLAFAIWILFFDNYSLIRQYKLRGELKELKEMEMHYRTQIAQNREELRELETNKETLEKFAREKYLMKKDNEDIFIVLEK